MPYVSYSDQQQYVPQAELAAADSARANDTLAAQNQLYRMRLEQMLRREAALEAARTKAQFAQEQAIQNQANAMERITVGASSREKLAMKLEESRNNRFKASEAAKAKKDADAKEMKIKQMEQQDQQFHERLDELSKRGAEKSKQTDALLNSKNVDAAVKAQAQANRDKAKSAASRLVADAALSRQYSQNISKLYASKGNAFGNDARAAIDAEIERNRTEMKSKLLPQSERDKLEQEIRSAQDENDGLWKMYGAVMPTTQPAQPVATTQPTSQPAPQLTLTREQAKAILSEAGGDKDKARELARSRGYALQ